jgi:hypothetical protein
VTHVAESEEEFQMYMYRQGPMHDWLKSQRDMSDCGLGSPIQHLERCGYLEENLLAIQTKNRNIVLIFFIEGEIVQDVDLFEPKRE